jgi:hypothetical protein
MNKEISISGFVLCILYTSFSSCIRDNMSQFDLEMQKANCCGFKQEIHKNRTGDLIFTFQLVQKITRGGILNDISNGVDSFELRIWYPSIVDATDDVFVLKYDRQWQCRIYKHFREVTKSGELKYNWEIKRDYTAGIKFKNLLDSLTHNKLFLLKDCYDLRDYDYATDDKAVIFEIAGKGFYRFATYSGLMRQSGKYPEVVAAKSIIRFLDRKFGTDIVKGLNQ